MSTLDSAPAPTVAMESTPSNAIPSSIDNSAPEPENKPEPLKQDDDKKDKKQSRKPFAELLNKIRKPLEKSYCPEKKGELEPSCEDASNVAQAIPTETLAADNTQPEPTPDNVPDETHQPESTPRKDRGNHLFDKITAFVMKPKSPRGRKSEPAKDEHSEQPPAAATEDPNPATEAIMDSNPTDNSALTPGPSTEVPTQVQSDDAQLSSKPEELKSEKKEKSPKDLAKLARRFSGRIFGIEKKEKPKKSEVTQEEPEESNDNLAAADPHPEAASSPEQAEESTPAPNDTAPVITAAA